MKQGPILQFEKERSCIFSLISVTASDTYEFTYIQSQRQRCRRQGRS
jgi:hypothetical protein